MTISVGLIGFGLSGQIFHAPFIDSLENYKLSKIYTTDPSKAKIAEQKYPNATVCSDVEEIFRDKTIDLVVVATPNDKHFEYAKKALENGKHVVVEKPFTVSVEEAEKLVELSEKSSKILTVYQNRRYDSDFKTVKKVIKSGFLGELVEYEAHFDRFRNYSTKNGWREKQLPGAGILYDLGPHLIDQALYLFGMPRTLFADVKAQRSFSTVDDYFEITLFYDKLKVILKSSMLVKESLPKYVLTGENGNFVKYGGDPQEENLRKGLKPDDPNWGKEPEEYYGILNVVFNGVDIRTKVESEKGDYKEFYTDLFKAIVEGSKPPVSPQEGLNVMKIIELSFKSSELKKVIHL